MRRAGKSRTWAWYAAIVRILGPPFKLLSAAIVLLLAVSALAAVRTAPDAALPTLELERVFPALTFDRPVLLTHAGDGSSGVYVVEQHGVIHGLDPAAPERTDVFLDISDRVSRRGNEEGLLGLAFDPGFAENGRFYVYYSAAAPRRSVLSRFETGADGRGGPASESVVLEVPQPYANHNGGMIAFGPDGMLYAALGDGGSAGDPQRNGQDLGTLLGSILRIDVTQPDSGAPYAIPYDNPFVGQSGARGEIWAYGLRNAWRFSFDRETGDLWAGDVGQNALEEVNIVRRGGNYGWNVMEGSRCFRSSCDAAGFEAPVVEYGRDAGCSVTGGYAYRGQRLPELRGVYLYADYCSGRIWGLRHDGGRVTEHAQLARASFPIPSFGEDSAGEVYVLGFDGGIYTFAATSEQSTPSSAPTPTSRRSSVSTPAVASTPTPESPRTSAPAADAPPPATPASTLAAKPAATPVPALPDPGADVWAVAVAVAVTALAGGLIFAWRRYRSARRS